MKRETKEDIITTEIIFTAMLPADLSQQWISEKSLQFALNANIETLRREVFLNATRSLVLKRHKL
jgi:hypothetical protein